MARRPDIGLLQRIAAIRNLQRAAAELAAGRVARAVREKTEDRVHKEQDRDQAEKAWNGTLAGDTIAAEMVPLWAAQLVGRERAVRRADIDVRQATTDLEGRAAAWRTAIKRAEGSQDAAKSAAKDRARQREEAALQDACDGHLHRKMAE